MAEILQVNARSPEAAVIAQAARLVLRGEVVAIPTDTFYGLAANPFDAAGVEKVFSIKGRSKDNPLLLLVDSLAMAVELSADVPPRFLSLAERFWPGPLTLVVKAAAKVPPSVTGGTGRVGLRLPAAAVPVALIRAAGCPVTATSANRTGAKECATAQQVEAALGGRLPLILDGGPSGDGGMSGNRGGAAKASTVVSLSGEHWEMLREGAIARSEIERFFRKTV